jgi:DNA-binding response OmpR family regulator
MKLLLIEDEKRMAQALMEILRLENYEVDLCTDGISGAAAVESHLYDLIILDVMLPGKSGFEIARQARRDGIKTPILMLTAKEQLEDKVTGLDSGADDYLTKPFMTQELLARLRALSRRIINSPDGTLSFGDISLEVGNSTLSCTANGQSVRLKEKEYRLMEYLIANQGQILDREQLALKIWGYDSEAEYNNVEVYLSFTRKKLAFIGSAVEIKAVRGLGYELRYPHV